MQSKTITIQADIAKEPENVWEYWTKPEHITQWNFASDDWCCPSARNDLRVGGRLETRMEAKNGSFGFDFGGTYDEVEVPKRIAYTLDDGRKVITTLEPKESGTHMITLFDPESQNPIDMQRDGWQAIMNNFKKYVEGL